MLKRLQADVNKLISLLEKNFSKDIAYYNWKHNLNENYGIEEYTFCIFKNNLCIATTHGDYRRLVLFEMLLSHINIFCSDKNVAFVYSATNEKSKQALLKLGFKDFFKSFKASKLISYNHPVMKVYSLLLNSFKKITIRKNIIIIEISIKEYARFFNIQDVKHSMFFEKNETYLNWLTSKDNYFFYWAFGN